MYKYILFFIVVLLFFSGCGEQITETIIHSTILKEVEGKNFGIIYIDSDKFYWREHDQEIKNKMRKFLKTTNYDIIKINSNYYKWYLASVEIYYNQPY